MRGKCGQPLLKEVRTINGGVKLIPFKTYCYYPIERSLKSMVACEGFLEKCKEWQTRTCEENVYRDVYDGEVWKTFTGNTGFYKSTKFTWPYVELGLVPTIKACFLLCGGNLCCSSQSTSFRAVSEGKYFIDWTDSPHGA